MVLLVLVSLPAACGDPGDQYDNFVARADRRPADVGSSVRGVLADVTGDYLYNIALKPLGDVFLELRVTFTRYELSDDGETAVVAGEFRFGDETAEDTPLETFESVLDADGFMTILVGPVRIEADRSPIKDTAVEAKFILDVIVLDERSQCGFIADEQSVVTEPISLGLRGTTFGAQRFGPLGEKPTNVPTQCPFVDAGGDPDPDLDAGTSDAPEEGGDELVPPDVDLGEGQLVDVTGRFWLKAALAGAALELDLILDLQYFESEDGASIDGSLRSVNADPGDPAIEQFSEPVDDNGEFSVVLQGLATDSPLGPVEADIALAGIILDADTLCGEAAGEVLSPLTVNLRGTTFAAVRIPDASFEEPDDALSACPE